MNALLNRLLGSVTGRTSDQGQAGSPKSITLTQTPAAIYAVGDVHGCYDLYRSLEALIVADGEKIKGKKLIVLLGDMIDRGPDSASLIDHLVAAPPRGFERIALLGNHEDMMRAFLRRPDRSSRWLRAFGGRETLLSYGMAPDPEKDFELPARRLRHLVDAHIPAEHLAYLNDLPVALFVGDFLFTHAGYDTSKPIEQQNTDDLIWGKPHKADYDDEEYTVIHGHIPEKEVTILPKRIGVDTGAYFSGCLSAVRLMPGKDIEVISTRS